MVNGCHKVMLLLLNQIHSFVFGLFFPKFWKYFKDNFIILRYNTDENTDRVNQFPILGDVEMVARDASRTEVIVMVCIFV